MSSDSLPRVVLVVASPCPAEIFGRATFLGQSLNHFPESLQPELVLLAENRGSDCRGLSEFYNEAIEMIEGEAIVAFVHDDIYIHDWNLRFSLSQALCFWDVVGVVGSSGVGDGQPNWSYELNDNGSLILSSRVCRSGCINEFDPSRVNPYVYGPAPMACDLLDGMFLAADLQRLRQKGLRFDSQFRFHCYDTDFCYSARALGMSVGTWPIPVTHGSSYGSFHQEWLAACLQLQRKWKPTATASEA